LASDKVGFCVVGASRIRTGWHQISSHESMVHVMDDRVCARSQQPNADGNEFARSSWADPGACSALCLLILDDRRSNGIPAEGDTSARHRRRPLPPALYAECIAPFLRFDMPLPNMLYAFGGRNQRRGPLNTVEMFDTWHGCWVPCPPMPTRRAGSAAALLPDGRMIVVGGYNENGIAEGLLTSCDIYDPFEQCWDEAGAAPLTRARWGHGCALLGGKVYVVGGCSLQPEAQPREASMETLRCCEVYEPTTNRWSSCSSLQIARSGSRVVALDERYLVAIGGCDDVFGRAETQPTVEIFDLHIGHWSLLDSRLTHPRTTAAVAAVDDCRLLVVGGAPSLSSAEVYRVQLPRDRNSDEQKKADPLPQVADMPDGRMGCQAAAINLPCEGEHYPMTNRKSVVIIGGERCDEGGGDWPRVRQFANVPVYDVETGEWRSDSVVPAMAAPRTAVALCVGVGRVAPGRPRRSCSSPLAMTVMAL